jgi:hypothetical protein
VFGQHVGKQQRIGVRALTGQEHQRMKAVQLAQPFQSGRIGL